MRAAVRRARARLVEERGDTLVEVMIAVVILGVAFVGLLFGLGSAAKNSAIHRSSGRR